MKDEVEFPIGRIVVVYSSRGLISGKVIKMDSYNDITWRTIEFPDGSHITCSVESLRKSNPEKFVIGEIVKFPGRTNSFSVKTINCNNNRIEIQNIHNPNEYLWCDQWQLTKVTPAYKKDEFDFDMIEGGPVAADFKTPEVVTTPRGAFKLGEVVDRVGWVDDFIIIGFQDFNRQATIKTMEGTQSRTYTCPVTELITKTKSPVNTNPRYEFVIGKFVRVKAHDNKSIYVITDISGNSIRIKSTNPAILSNGLWYNCSELEIIKPVENVEFPVGSIVVSKLTAVKYEVLEVTDGGKRRKVRNITFPNSKPTKMFVEQLLPNTEEAVKSVRKTRLDGWLSGTAIGNTLHEIIFEADAKQPVNDHQYAQILTKNRKSKIII